MAYKLPRTRRYKNGDTYASLEASSKGYTVTYSRNGRVVSSSDFTISNGYNRSVGRIEALRELKRFNFKDITKK